MVVLVVSWHKQRRKVTITLNIVQWTALTVLKPSFKVSRYQCFDIFFFTQLTLLYENGFCCLIPRTKWQEQRYYLFCTWDVSAVISVADQTRAWHLPWGWKQLNRWTVQCGVLSYITTSLLCRVIWRWLLWFLDQETKLRWVQITVLKILKYLHTIQQKVSLQVGVYERFSLPISNHWTPLVYSVRNLFS